MAMGGRAAEEVVFNEFSSGAAGDLNGATQRAHAMVCEWGMSDLGPISFGTNAEVFLGRDFIKERNFSEETASAVDNEIHRLLKEAYADAKALVLKHRDILDALAKDLMERETLEADDIDRIITSNGGAAWLPPRRIKKKEPEPVEPKAIPVAAPPPRPIPVIGEVQPQPGGVVPGTA
jgi:cell division protease FtsH